MRPKINQLKNDIKSVESWTLNTNKGRKSNTGNASFEMNTSNKAFFNGRLHSLGYWYRRIPTGSKLICFLYFLCHYGYTCLVEYLWGDQMCPPTKCHDDVIKWKHFPHCWSFVRGIHWSPVNSPHKGQWRRALMFSLICAWINGWVNNGKAGD